MKITRRTAFGTLAAGLAGAAAGAGAYGFVYERHRIELVQVALPVHELPPALEGLRVGLLTDIHHSAFLSRDDVDTAARLLMSASPDLIVLGGDFVTWRDVRYLGPCVEILGQLSAPHGVFAVLGNHDDEAATPGAMRARGLEVLKDARTRVVINGQPLELVGIRYWTTQVNQIGALLRGAAGPVVLLAHDPRRLTEASVLRVPAVLSGHTHGGQVALPVVGALAARRFPVVAGIARRDGTTIFVSRGLGTVVVPIRLNCPPEVAILTLTSAATA